MRRAFRPYRDELIISSKAGWDMWPGPYGQLGSRKDLLASLDASLERLALDYVDIFYSHRFDPETPLEETVGALSSAVQSGKCRYVGISSYSGEQTREAVTFARRVGAPLVSGRSRKLFSSTLRLLPREGRHARNGRFGAYPVFVASLTSSGRSVGSISSARRSASRKCVGSS
jgi:hypothetical protein